MICCALNSAVIALIIDVSRRGADEHQLLRRPGGLRDASTLIMALTEWPTKRPPSVEVRTRFRSDRQRILSAWHTSWDHRPTK